VTGSRDTTLMLWSVNSGRGASSSAPLISEKPRHVLHGHDDEVLCVVASSDVDTVLSGSRDGSAILYTLRSGQYARTVQQPEAESVDLVALSSDGWVVLYSRAGDSLHSCTINPRHAHSPRASASAGERLSAVCFSSTGDLLLSAGERGAVVLRRPHDLAVVHELRAQSDERPGGPGPLRSLTLSAMEDFVLAGTQRGTLLVWSTRTSEGDARLREQERQELSMSVWGQIGANGLSMDVVGPGGM
jgi:WD40 repeat protein